MYIAWTLLLVALSSSVRNLVVLDLVRSLWWNMGVQLGRSQPRAGLVGRHSRDETGVATPLPPCHAAVETSLPPCLVNQVWSLGVIHHASKQKRTVKMQSWRTAQKPIRPRSTRRSRQTTNCVTNMPEEHRTLIYCESFKSKMESLDDEKAAWQPKGNSYPCKVGSKTEELSGAGKRSNRNRRSVWKSCKNGSRLIRNWKQPTPNRYKPSMRWRCWWLNSLQKMPKVSIKEIQGSSPTCQDPSLIKLHNKPFSQCSNPFSRCKAWGATVFRNSSWRLDGDRDRDPRTWSRGA